MTIDTSGLVNQPQQERSQVTMNQILDAAAAILESKAFDELTVAEVVQQAGTSVGAFYGRFKDKEALLLALDERFFEEFERALNVIVFQPGWIKQPIQVIIRVLVEFMVAEYSKRQGLMRSLNVKARMQSKSLFKEREQRIWIKMFPLFHEIVVEHQAEIAHPKPFLAAELGCQQLVFTIHELFLWGPLREDRTYEKDELCSELVRSFLSYLEVKNS
jgi:AcrR family transcriptional regulator